jgi:YQGE family putative transporter
MDNSINYPKIKRLLISHAFFTFARDMFKIFISLYIWNITHRLSDVAIFHITFYLSHCLFFALTAIPVKKGYANAIKQLGLIGLIGFYLFLFFIKENAANHLIFTAVLWGIFNSMYWVSYHVQQFDITHTTNRGHYEGTYRALKIITGIFAPILAGSLISFDAFGWGYGNVFLLGVILQTVALFFGFIRIEQKKMPPFHLFQTIRLVLNNRDTIKIISAGIASDMGYGRSLGDLLTLFLFIALGSELHVGGWVSFFAMVSAASVYLIARHIPYSKYKTVSLISGGTLGASIIFLILFPRFLMYIIFGSIKQLCEPLLGTVRQVYSLNLVHQFDNHESHRVEYIVLRECAAVGIGATLSFIPLLFFSEPSIKILAPILIIMASITLTEPLLVNSIKTNITKL